MIQVLSSETVNRIKWDALVEQYENPSQFFHFSWYLDAVSPKWKALVYNDYECIFPLTSTIKMGFNFFVQPIFTREFNVIGPYSDDVLAQMLMAVKKFNFSYFGTSTNFNDAELSSTARCFQLVKLDISYEQAHQNYSENIKRLLKKSISAGIEVRAVFDPQTLVELFKNEKGGEFTHLGNKEYTAISQLMIAANAANCAYQINAYASNELIASSFYLVSQHQVLFLKGAVNKMGKSIGAMAALHDHALKVYCNKLNYFDFGGSNSKGLREFNLKFGAIDMNYLLLSLNNLPWPAKNWVNKKYKLNA